MSADEGWQARCENYLILPAEQRRLNVGPRSSALTQCTETQGLNGACPADFTVKDQ